MHSPETLVALARATPKLAEDLHLEPGEYPIDATITVRLLGLLTKLADTDYTPTAEIPLLDSLAIFVSRMPDRARTLAIWEESVRAALAGDGAVSDGIRGDLEQVHARIRSTLKALPKKTRSGATRCAVQATIIERPASDDLPLIVGGYTPRPGKVSNQKLKPPRGGSAVQRPDEQTSVPRTRRRAA